MFWSDLLFLDTHLISLFSDLVREKFSSLHFGLATDPFVDIGGVMIHVYDIGLFDLALLFNWPQTLLRANTNSLQHCQEVTDHCEKSYVTPSTTLELVEFDGSE